jgi:hypothetical protein
MMEVGPRREGTLVIQVQSGTAAAAGARRTGVIGDGVFKVLLGAGFLVGAVGLGHTLGVPIWLMIASGAALMASGGIEIRYVRRRMARTYLRLMIAYDSGWLLATLAGLLIAWRGGSAGGEVWTGYQAVAPLLLTALLLIAPPAQRLSVLRAENPVP